MASFYGKARKTASKLLNKFGVKVTIQRTTKGVFDPVAGKYGPDTAIEWTPYAVRTSIKEEMFSDTRIKVGDMLLLVDCEKQPHIPKQGDRVLFPSGEKWVVTVDMPVDPAGTVVLYKGVIRKG